MIGISKFKVITFYFSSVILSPPSSSVPPLTVIFPFKPQQQQSSHPQSE